MSMPLRLKAALQAAVFACVAYSGAWAQEYRFGRGDSVAILVLGYPDLTRKVTIDAAGSISLPFIGKFKVEGLTSEDVRATVTRLLAEKNVVRGSEVAVDVAEYAPFYISGDVAKPGAFAFRPGMTVRHAVALAGGFGARPDDASYADLWGQQRTTVIALVKAQLKNARLQSELAGDEKVNLSNVDTTPVDREFAQKLIEAENNQFNARTEDRRREVAALKSLAEEARRQIVALEAQFKAEEENIRSLNDDLDRMRSLFDRRLAPATRLSDAQQALALNKARLSATSAQLAEIRRLRMDLERRAERFADGEKIKIMAEAQESLAEIETLKVRLQVSRMKLDEARGQGNTVNSVEVKLFRGGSTEPVAATEGTEIRSGDMVEIRLPGDRLSTDTKTRPRASAADR